MDRNSSLGSLYMTGTALMFAGAFVATRYTVGVASPGLAAALRFLFASLALHAVLAVKGPGQPIARQDWLGLAFLGITGIFAYNVLFFWALQYTTASLSSLLVPTTIPIATIILARLMYKEALGPRRLVGIGLAALGAVLALGRSGELLVEDGLGWRGEAALLAAVVCFALYTVVGQRLVRRYGALRTTAHATTMGTILLVLAAWPTWTSLPEVPGAAWLAIMFMGIGSSAAGLVWYYQGGELLGAGKAAVFLYLVPLFTVVLSVLVLHETLQFRQLLGGAIIIGGVVTARGTRDTARDDYKTARSAQIKEGNL